MFNGLSGMLATMFMAGIPLAAGPAGTLPAEATASAAPPVATSAAAPAAAASSASPAPPEPSAAPPAATTVSTAQWHGISLSELQVAPVSPDTVKIAEAQVQAAHDAWHATAVRLQIEQDELTAPDGSCPLTTPGCLGYFREIKQVVGFALKLGLVVVVNDTTLPAPGFQAAEPMPTAATEMFWKDIAGAFGGNPRVIFDLFNEPRGQVGSGAPQWQVWRDGGLIQGSPYLGMQTLLGYVRNDLRATNTVWVDGINSGGTLNGIAAHDAPGTADGAPGSVGSYALSQAGDLVTGPLVYTFHHPMGYRTVTAWWRDFGYLHDLGYAVMDGEWNNAVDGREYCWNDAPVAIPAYLHYLATEQIGLTAWEIGPNVNAAVGAAGGGVTWAQSTPFPYQDFFLAESPVSYETPTTLAGDPAEPWDCGNSNDAGAGQLLMAWFAAGGS